MSFRKTQRLRDLKSGSVKPYESVLQLHHSQWRQGHVPKDFRPLASLGVTVRDNFLERVPAHPLEEAADVGYLASVGDVIPGYLSQRGGNGTALRPGQNYPAFL